MGSRRLSGGPSEATQDAGRPPATTGDHLWVISRQHGLRWPPEACCRRPCKEASGGRRRPAWPPTKGLENTLTNLLPQAEHRNCARHIYANWKKKGHSTNILKNLFWAAVKCTTIEKFRRIIREMTALKPEAAQDFVNVGVQKFCRAYISEWPKCETIDNNICECFNNYILQFRSLPIIDMLEGIRSTIMERIVRMRELFSNRTDQLCPRIREMVERNKLESRTYFLKPVGCRQFEVSKMGNRFVVDLRVGTCSCRYWGMRGVPCCHAIACIHWNKENPADYVVDWLKRDAYELAYSHGIAPMNGKNMWVEVGGNYVFPPLVKRQPGRPKQRRRVDISEKELKGRNFGKKGVPMKCSLCQQVGHNRKTCIRRRMQAAGQGSEGGEHQGAMELPLFQTYDAYEPTIDMVSQVSKNLEQPSEPFPIHNTTEKGEYSSRGTYGKGRKSIGKKQNTITMFRYRSKSSRRAWGNKGS
ncbi:uncharacterized protein LOC144705990 [Wolffia australiana]